MSTCTKTATHTPPAPGSVQAASLTPPAAGSAWVTSFPQNASRMQPASSVQAARSPQPASSVQAARSPQPASHVPAARSLRDPGPLPTGSLPTAGTAQAASSAQTAGSTKPAELVFNRREEKYLLSEASAHALIQRLGADLVPDQYGRTFIRNLYLDTPEFSLIRRSLDKPFYKEKLRVRTYGLVESTGHQAFVEIKKKIDGQVYKRRMAQSLQDAQSFIEQSGLQDDDSNSGGWGGVGGGSNSSGNGSGGGDSGGNGSGGGNAPHPNTQIARELAWSISSYRPLEPAISVFYERCAYTYPGLDGNVRLTIDRHITAKLGSWSDFFLPYNAPELTLLLEPGNCVMEIKVLGALPLPLVRVLSECELYPTGFSKVGTAYRHFAATAHDMAATYRAATAHNRHYANQPITLFNKA